MAGSVQETTHEGLPTGYQLDLVEKQRHRPVGRFGKQAKMGIRDQMKLGRFQAGESLILEIEVELPMGRMTGMDPIRPALVEKTRLACSPHPDDRGRLAPKRRQQRIAPGQPRGGVSEAARIFSRMTCSNWEFNRAQSNPI